MNVSNRLQTLKRIRRFSRLLDSAFRVPGTRFRFGLDPIIGLVPGAGDLVTTLFSAYLILLATRYNLPTATVGKMIFNVALEFVVGTIPLVGDIFDAFFKANNRNFAMLEAHLLANEPELEVALAQQPEQFKEPLAS